MVHKVTSQIRTKESSLTKIPSPLAIGTTKQINKNVLTSDITFDTDVTNNPFPFTEENNKSYEHVEYGQLP